ncbi:MAG: tripartite tricarboxylate transporter TctB family protein [Gemmatimonadaceae bacterium]|nr:tripartite tricarboxylate transporter TctB family protein [Acetobacteraceae bacterium]
MDHSSPTFVASPGVVRSPQNVLAGTVMLALAGLAVFLVGDLAQGTLQSLGPAMLPRVLAAGVGLCGVALIASGLTGSGDALERFTLRGPVFVMLAVTAFALTIRPMPLGAFTTPGLGLLVAGPLAIVLSGYATAEARFKDLLILALSLTPFCMILFGDILNLPIPLFPQALADALPDGWSQRDALRAAAGTMVAAAVVVWLAGRAMRRD